MTGGFRVQRTVYRLRFADRRLAEAVVRVRAMSVDEMMDMIEDFDGDMTFDGTVTATMAERTPTLFDWFVTFLEEWNLETEEGEPIPATVDGLKSLEFALVMKLILTWLTATAGVEEDLKGEPESGEPSLAELTLPMEVLSPNQAS